VLLNAKISIILGLTHWKRGCWNYKNSYSNGTGCLQGQQDFSNNLQVFRWSTRLEELEIVVITRNSKH